MTRKYIHFHEHAEEVPCKSMVDLAEEEAKNDPRIKSRATANKFNKFTFGDNQ